VKINAMQVTSISSDTYKVTADMATSNGEYFETFIVKTTLEGPMITDHYTIRPAG